MAERPAFEAGQIWRSRSGELYLITTVDPEREPYPVHAKTLDGELDSELTAYGRFWADPDEPDGADLIKLVSEAPGAAEKCFVDEAIRNSVAAWCKAKAEAEAKPPTQTPTVNLRLEALKLAVQWGSVPDDFVNIDNILGAAKRFLAFLDSPPPAETDFEDELED